MVEEEFDVWSFLELVEQNRIETTAIDRIDVLDYIVSHAFRI